MMRLRSPSVTTASHTKKWKEAGKAAARACSSNQHTTPFLSTAVNAERGLWWSVRNELRLSRTEAGRVSGWTALSQRSGWLCLCAVRRGDLPVEGAKVLYCAYTVLLCR